MKKFSLGFSTNWKSFISPTIVATLILIVTLYLFGAQNSMIAPFVTISYLHFINMKNHYACMVRQLLLYLLIAAASYIAVISLPLCILVNAGMLFLLAFLVTDEYHPTNYEPMGMALIFFQTAALSTPKALGERLLAILVSFGIILLFVAVTGARYGKKDPIRDLVLQGFGICEQLVQICETDTLDKNMTSCNMNTHSPNQHADVHTTSTANEYSNTYNTDFFKKASAINTDRPTSSEKEGLTQQIIDLNHQISDEIYSYNRSTFRRKGKVNFYCSFVVMFQVVNYMLANTQVPGNLDKAKNLLRNYRALLDVENPKNDYWMLLLRSDRLDLHDFKFQFIYSILYKPCIFKAYRLLNVQTLCIFPCFCPYEPKQGKFLFSADYLIQQSCGSTLRFPCSVSVNVHCGTDISVSEKFLHIFRCCTV